MNKSTITGIIIGIIVIIAIGLYFYVSQGNGQNDDEILFKSFMGGGPCPPDMICWSSVELYYSGRLVINGSTVAEKQLDKETVNEIIDEIKNSGIMDKNCEAMPLVDAWGTCYIYAEGKNKTIEYPGCDEEIGGIEELIPKE